MHTNEPKTWILDGREITAYHKTKVMYKNKTTCLRCCGYDKCRRAQLKIYPPERNRGKRIFCIERVVLLHLINLYFLIRDIKKQSLQSGLLSCLTSKGALKKPLPLLTEIHLVLLIYLNACEDFCTLKAFSNPISYWHYWAKFAGYRQGIHVISIAKISKYLIFVL